MDIDYRKENAEKVKPYAAAISKRIRDDGKVRYNRKKKRVAQRIHIEAIQKGLENTVPELRHVLIDYKNNNQQIKSKMMTPYEAGIKNNLLRGSGFAWARCGGASPKY